MKEKILTIILVICTLCLTVVVDVQKRNTEKELTIVKFKLDSLQNLQTNKPLVTNSKNNIYLEALKSSQTDYWIYNAAYQTISYPNGDVSTGGACTDLVIRILRRCELDLQKEIHDDISANFKLYPNKWGLSKPDKNIDHRRVPNIMTYFNKKGYSKVISNNIYDYKPGDIICWSLESGLTHIGIYMGEKTVYHNIGPVSRIEEDFLFEYAIIGHYRINNL